MSKRCLTSWLVDGQLFPQGFRGSIVSVVVQGSTVKAVPTLRKPVWLTVHVVSKPDLPLEVIETAVSLSLGKRPDQTWILLDDKGV